MRVYNENTKCMGCGCPLPTRESAASGYLCLKCWLEFRRGGLVSDNDPRYDEFDKEYNASTLEEDDDYIPDCRKH